MNFKKRKKIIAVIREGHSDYCVIKHLIVSIFKCHCSVELQEDNFFEFESLNISQSLQKYLATARRENDYSRYSDHAEELKDRIFQVLHTALGKISKETEIPLSNQDVLILSADTELVLDPNNRKRDDIIKATISKLESVIWLAVEDFYDRMVTYCYSYTDLPLVLPLVLFPSSEILVASCMYDFRQQNFRALRPKPDLKQKVYETDNIPEAFESGKLEEVLSMYVVPEKLDRVYRAIPEARKLIQILSYCSPAGKVRAAECG